MPSDVLGLYEWALDRIAKIHGTDWTRAFAVARGYAAGASLTRAALDAGFASSAHLSATSRESFGIRPSQILSPGNRARIVPSKYPTKHPTQRGVDASLSPLP